MSEKTIEGLLKNTPLAVIAIGLLLFVIGAAGGWPSPQLQVNEMGWRIALAVMGAVVASVGALLRWQENISKQAETAQGNKYHIRIVSPNKVQVQDVEQNFDISGTYERIPPEDSVIFFVVYGRQFWPIMRPGNFHVDNDGWHANVHIGGDPGPRTVIVATMGKAGRALCQFHWKVGDNNGCWSAIDDMAPFISECDRVIVNRK